MANPANNLTTVADFDGRDGYNPEGGLILDASGDLLGVTQTDLLGGNGTVFEIPKSGAGYGAIRPLIYFEGTNGQSPSAGFAQDASGDLFGTTSYGGAFNVGTVFEIPQTATGYGTLTTLASLSNAIGSNSRAALLVDPSGNLFGTAFNGASGDGSVFEIPKTATGYGTLKTLQAFAGYNGANPAAGLIEDAAGNLFGTTVYGGGSNQGTVFEIQKTATGYATLRTIASFNGSNGQGPYGGLTFDRSGNLVGTTIAGGASNLGTVFTIPKTGTGFGTLSTLLSFNGSNGEGPLAGVLVDAAGDIFGTAGGNGRSDNGSVFEIPHALTGYGAVTTLASFNGTDGAAPWGDLVADGSGNLFGTTHNGGPQDVGTVFEVKSVFARLAWRSPTLGAAIVGGTTITLSGVVTDPQSTVTVYNGEATPANSLGLAVVAADGVWSLTTALPAGTYGALEAVATSGGQPVTVKAPFSLQTGITGEPYTSSTTTFDPSGHGKDFTTYDHADGSVYAILTRTVDGGLAVSHPGITGEPYSSSTNVYAADGTLKKTTYGGFTGRPYTSSTTIYGPAGQANQDVTTDNRADGSVYAILTRTQAGGLSVAHPDVRGTFYTSFTNIYTAGVLTGSSYAGYGGLPFDTEDRSYAPSGTTIFEATLRAGFIVQTTSFDAAGAVQGTTDYAGPAGQTVTNTGLFDKAGTADTWRIGTPFANTGTIDVESGALLLSQGAANAGTIDVGAYAKLGVTGALTGSGTLDLHGAGSMVELGAGSSTTVAFTDAAAATLLLDDAPAFHGQIQGFGSQSLLDLKSFSGSSTLAYAPDPSNTAGVLTVADGSRHASLALAGTFTTGDFAAPVTDQSGTGVLIRLA